MTYEKSDTLWSIVVALAQRVTYCLPCRRRDAEAEDEAMAFKVKVAGDRAKQFDTADAALRHAEKRVYLAWQRRDEALRTLEDGKSFSYTYGFDEVQIAPI